MKIPASGIFRFLLKSNTSALEASPATQRPTHTKSVLITPLFSKRRGDGEKLAAKVEKGVYEADLVSTLRCFSAVEARSLLDEAGEGRRTRAEEAARQDRRIRQLCPEDSAILDDRICSWMVGNL